MRNISIKSFHFAVVICAFVVTAVAQAAAPYRLPSCAAGTAVPIQTQQISKDIQLIRMGPDLAVERITGEAALSHLRNLMSSNPAAFAKSRENLAARGYTPTEQVFVERTLRRVGSSGRREGSPYRLVQTYSEANSDGEIVFWSWTDGNDATWEGSIHVKVYSNGAQSTWDGQINASTDSHPWVWYEKTWERPPREPMEVRFAVPPQPRRGHELIQLARSAPTMSNNNIFLAGSFYNWAVCWRAAVVGGCTTAAVACRFSGPGWPGCFGAWCVGVEVGSAISCYLAN